MASKLPRPVIPTLIAVIALGVSVNVQLTVGVSVVAVATVAACGGRAPKRQSRPRLGDAFVATGRHTAAKAQRQSAGW